MLRFLFLLGSTVLLSAQDPYPHPVPGMWPPGTWEWSALYADGTGRAVILAMGAKEGVRMDLGTGARPMAEATTIDPAGRLTRGTWVADRGRHLVAPDLPLAARWVTIRRTDGVDQISSTVPIPVQQDHPLHALLSGHQAAHLARAVVDLTITTDSPRIMPDEEPLPSGTWRWYCHALTEVTWWSASLVSTLDWTVTYAGGVHSNIVLAGHTWRRTGDGTWNRVRLTDILGPEDGWMEQVLSLIITDLRRQEAGWYLTDGDVSRPKAEKLTTVWSIAEDALVFSFAPYVVGPYSQGVMQVRVPWTELGVERPR